MNKWIKLLLLIYVVVMIPIYFIIPRWYVDQVVYFSGIAVWIYVLTRDAMKYMQTRKGIYATGTITAATSGPDRRMYVDFISPTDNKPYRILYENGSAIWEPESDQAEVWVNKNDAGKSVVVDRGSWTFTIVTHIVLLVVFTGVTVFLFW